MAEKTVATIISKSLEQTPKFSGKSDQNVEEWLPDLSAKFRMASLTEPQAVKIISTFLDEPVKEWYTENIATFESWNQFKDVFITTYISPATKQLASHRLRTRQQRPNEPIIEYYTAVMKLCKTVDPNMTDASKLDHLSHSLKSSLLREVLRHAPTTPAAFLEHAKHEEVLDCLVTNSVTIILNEDQSGNSTSTHHDSSSPQFSAVNPASSHRSQGSRVASSHHLAQRSSHHNRHQQPPSHYSSSSSPSAFDSTPRSRSFRCLNCNKPGHFARDCWSTKKGFRNFTNKTVANYWRKSRACTGESSVEFRQLASVQ